MEASGGDLDAYGGSSVISSSNSRRYGMQLSASNFFHSPLSTLLEYSGILRTRSNYSESESSINSNGVSVGYQDHIRNDSSPVANNGGEVSIRLIGAGEQEHMFSPLGRLWMELGLIAGILRTRDMTYSRLRDGLSRCFHSLCFSWWFLSGSICKVSAAGDLCAICQENMHAPILLRCKHIFCEDCVSEWFERERTRPLCRALVKPADLRSFGDGSTSLFFQLF